MPAIAFAVRARAGVHLVAVSVRTLPSCHDNHINLGGQVDKVFVVVVALPDFLLMFAVAGVHHLQLLGWGIRDIMQEAFCRGLLGVGLFFFRLLHRRWRFLEEAQQGVCLCLGLCLRRYLFLLRLTRSCEVTTHGSEQAGMLCCGCGEYAGTGEQRCILNRVITNGSHVRARRKAFSIALALVLAWGFHKIRGDRDQHYVIFKQMK